MNHAPYDDCDKAKEGFCLFRNTMTAKPCGRSGSSLIQILICVAIIGLLASLLMPFFETALKNARSAKCVSNLRQLWHAGMLFAQEHNGRFCSLNIDKSENDAKSPGFREYLGYSSMLYKETAYSCPQAQRSEVAGGGYMFRSYGINRLTVANWAPADSGGHRGKWRPGTRPQRAPPQQDALSGRRSPQYRIQNRHNLRKRRQLFHEYQFFQRHFGKFHPCRLPECSVCGRTRLRAAKGRYGKATGKCALGRQ